MNLSNPKPIIRRIWVAIEIVFILIFLAFTAASILYSTPLIMRGQFPGYGYYAVLVLSYYSFKAIVWLYQIFDQ
jgi:hypothetical protein